MRHSEHISQKTYLESKTQVFSQRLEQALEERLLALDRMADRFISTDKDNEKKWISDSQNYIHHFRGLEGIFWINNSKHIRWKTPQSIELQEDLLKLIRNETKLKNQNGSNECSLYCSTAYFEVKFSINSLCLAIAK